MAERSVLVTGGTRGIGLATGLAFAREGARVILTHRWGSVEPAETRATFAAAGVSTPEIIDANVASDADTRRLLDTLGGPVDVFVSNVCVAGRGKGTLQARVLKQSLGFSSWPLVRYLDAMKREFGRLPRHAVAISSDGHEHFYPGYDYVAASKALLEALCVHLARREPDLRVNAIRARQVDTASFREMFGDKSREIIRHFADFDLDPDEVAGAATALCSDDLAALSGQVLVIDRGATPLDNLVNAAPRLMGTPPTWEARENASGRPPGVLYVDAGIPAAGFDFGTECTEVGLEDCQQLDPQTIPDTVVVGHDWAGTSLDEVEQRSRCLVALMQRAEEGDGKTPRYGVQIDRGDSPGLELSRCLARYWTSWRVTGDTRINFVTGHGEPALRVTRALVSGRLDGMHGQVLGA